MFNSLKNKLNDAIDGLNRLEWAAPADLQAALRTVREALLQGGIEDRHVERFIHRVLDSMAGRDLMPGHDAARMVQQDLRAALAHVAGARYLFDVPRAGESTELNNNWRNSLAERSWSLKDFDRLAGRGHVRGQFRQPLMEHRIAGPLRLRGPHLRAAEASQVDDWHSGTLDACAINRMIASLRGDERPGQDPPDIGNPALI